MMRKILLTLCALVGVTLSQAQPVASSSKTLQQAVPHDQRVLLSDHTKSSYQVTSDDDSSIEDRSPVEVHLQQDAIHRKPAGTEYPLWSRKATCYIMEAGTLTVTDRDDGVMTTIVVKGDSVYLFNPVQAFPTMTWVGGVQRGDTIIFTTPQPIYAEEYNGQNYEYDLARLVKGDDESDYRVDEQNREIRFLWRGGRIEQIDGGMIGIIQHDNLSWTKIGDKQSLLYRVDDELQTPPDGARAETYRMEYKDEESTSGKRVVKVVRHGDALYIGNLWSGLEDKWIKGAVQDDKATFDSWQYIGADTVHNYHTYVVAATGELQDGVYYFTELPQITFTIDTESKTLTADESLLINCGKSRVYYQQAYMHPKLSYYEERATTPQMPVVFGYSDYGSEDTPDYGYVGFILLPFDEQGYELLTEKLFYRLYVDDKVYEFSPKEYPGLSVPTAEIPYGFTNKFNLIAYGDQHEVMFKVRDYEYLGVQVVYRGGGEEHFSEIAWQKSLISGIENIVNCSPLEHIVYYDLMGHRLTIPPKGLYICEIQMPGGAVVRTKHYAQ